MYVHFSLGDLYIQNVSKSRQKIAKLGNPFITDGTVYSILIYKILKEVLAIKMSCGFVLFHLNMNF